jgi:hypothetical protein
MQQDKLAPYYKHIMDQVYQISIIGQRIPPKLLNIAMLSETTNKRYACESAGSYVDGIINHPCIE